MIGLFMISIFISVLLFLMITYGLLNKGPLAGITSEDIREATTNIAIELEENPEIKRDEIIQILQSANENYPNMCFTILLESNEIIEGDKGIGIDSIKGLIKALSQKEQYQCDIWVESKEILLEGQVAYLIVGVEKSDFKTITYYFNGPKAKGVLGKIMLLGLFLTLIISSLVTYYFMKKMIARIEEIDHAIDVFEIGKLDVRIADTKQDELGKLSRSFNDMAKKIEEQVKIQETYEEKRKQLISNLSHDLRTPLASVVGYSELLLNGLRENEDEQRYIEIIYRKAIYMEKLLNELLEFSRLENGNLKLRLTKGDIVEYVREILIEYIPKLEEQQIELVAEIEEESIALEFDPDKLQRAIRNLIDNAMKYGMAARKLRIAVYEKEREVHIEIEDFGDGMNQETLQHIFERFYRGNKSRDTASGGMGLGLSISQEIIKQHGGILEVKSQIAKGTKATIKLPIK